MVEILIPYIEHISNNNLLVIFILSMVPITELRGSIPWAYFFTEIPLIIIFIISVLGNFLISVPIIIMLNPVITFLNRWYIGRYSFNWLFSRTRRKGAMIKKFHFLGLVLFVGIPLPVTGAWSGCIAAHLFGVSKTKALFAILIGLCLSASIICTLLITGNWIINA